LRSAARIASRDGSNAGSMSPARERRLSRPRGGGESCGSARAIGRGLTGAEPGADFLRETGGLLPDGLRDFGGCFDKCLLEK
jgi:hypothetical protein